MGAGGGHSRNGVLLNSYWHKARRRRVTNPVTVSTMRMRKETVVVGMQPFPNMGDVQQNNLRFTLVADTGACHLCRRREDPEGSRGSGNKEGWSNFLNGGGSLV